MPNTTVGSMKIRKCMRDSTEDIYMLERKSSLLCELSLTKSPNGAAVNNIQILLNAIFVGSVERNAKMSVHLLCWKYQGIHLVALSLQLQLLT
mmetsp:Transcript_12619/g.31020  ORF Transcript_12619/g.31020 Transcript_12619/m.31020 type:complete len:93 (+) Transcript_12619:2-280(+)